MSIKCSSVIFPSVYLKVYRSHFPQEPFILETPFHSPLGCSFGIFLLPSGGMPLVCSCFDLEGVPFHLVLSGDCFLLLSWMGNSTDNMKLK